MFTRLARRPLYALALTLTLCAMSTVSTWAADKAPAAAATAPAPRLLPDMIKGNPKAPITVIEYGSATCSHCAAWYEENFATFEADYIKTGKVKYIFREVPTPPVNLDYSLYMLARCASEKVNPTKPDPTPFFTIVEGFWRVQSSVYYTRDYSTPLKILGAKAGLSEADITRCTTDKALFSDIGHTIETRTKADGVKSTPTFFVNGTQVDGMELSDLTTAIANAAKAPASKH